MKYWMSILAALALTAVAPASLADEAAPDELIRVLSEQVLEIVRNDTRLQEGEVDSAIERIEAIVVPHFNFRRMTMLAVGRDWRQASQEQQRRLMDSFYGMLVRTYSNALTEYKDHTIDFRPLRMSPDDSTVRVQTAVRQPGAQAVSVDYMLERTEEGWKVFDIVVAGVSLVTNYRSAFAQEIRNGGIDGLIQALEARGGEGMRFPGHES